MLEVLHFGSRYINELSLVSMAVVEVGQDSDIFLLDKQRPTLATIVSNVAETVNMLGA